jgi:gelsolin
MTTGYVKQKEYKIADSNIALLGSDVEKKVKLASAQSEKAWEGVGKTPGLNIWRIEKFKVVPVDKKVYGHFHTGDSYILLHTYTKKDSTGSDKLYWDIHFWLGASTTQDEAGTAAYKTVELDTFLGGAPVQHREIEGHESELFLSYFASKGGIRIMEGGVESGFNHVKPTEYKPRLLHLKGKKFVRIVEVPLSHKSLNSGDCFILDAGLTIYSFIGKKAGIAEKQRVGQLAQAIDDERGGKPVRHVINEGDKGAEATAFWKALGGEGAVAADTGDDEAWEKKTCKILFHYSDESGKDVFTKKSEGKIHKKDLDSKDAFVIDLGNQVWVWVGKKASEGEKSKALSKAHSYLKGNDRPSWTPISRIVEGSEPPSFWAAFDS